MGRVKKERLTDQVKEFIREKIIDGTYRPGARIESIRKLAEEFGISHVSVASAIKQLAKEGILISKSGAGTHIAEKLPAGLNISRPGPNNLSKTLYFFFNNEQDWQNSLFREHILCVLQKEGEKRGWKIEVGFISGENIIHAGNDPAAIGIVHCIEPIFPYPDVKVPVIICGVQDDGIHTAVIPDNYRAGWDAGSIYTRSTAYKGVYYVTGDREPRPQHNNALHWDERYRGIADALSCQAGLTLPPPLHWQIYLNVRSEVETLLHKIRKEKSGPVLLFVANRNMANEIYICALSLGLRIPEDVSIVSFIRRTSGHRRFAIDTFDFNHVEMGNMIIRLLEYAHEGNPLPSRVMIPMTLISEGSTLCSEKVKK